MDTYTEIKNKIRAMVGQKTPLLLTGKVESVDNEKCTCTVSIGDLTLTDVRLRSVVNGESSKLLITPADNSYVTIIDLSGELRETEVIGYSQIKAIDIETSRDINIKCNGTITLNGGENHGLVNIQQLTEELNKIIRKFNAHTHPINCPVVAGQAQIGLAIGISKPTTGIATLTKGMYEDKNVRH